MKIIFFYVGLLLLFIASCKKQNGANGNIVEMLFTRAALQYVHLPLKRYFIYRDSASGTLDSVIVTTDDLNIYRHPGHKSTGLFDTGFDEYNIQIYKVELTTFSGQTSWFYGEAKADFYSPYPVADTSLPLILCALDNLVPKTTTLSDNCYYGFSYPALSGTNNFLPDMTVEGKTYNEVLKVGKSNGLQQDSLQSWYYSSDYYWAKNTGIIKRTVKTSTTVTTSTLLRFGN